MLPILRPTCDLDDLLFDTAALLANLGEHVRSSEHYLASALVAEERVRWFRSINGSAR